MPQNLKALFRTTPSWLVSVIVHVAIMFVALMIPMARQVSQNLDLLGSFPDEVEEDVYEIAAVTDQVGTSADANSSQLAQIASTQTGQLQTELQQKIESEFEDPDIKMESAEDTEVPTSEILSPVDRAGNSDGVEHAGGTAGAIDRITQEIQGSLRERRTLAIWLFDNIPSLKPRRQLIADRFENVYKQLDALEANKQNGLTTVVASYAEKLEVLTKEPVNDVRQVIAKVRAIQDIKTKNENTFGAVKEIATKFQRYRKDHGGQNVMIIVVTDERGSDPQNLDETVLLCKRYGMRVYTVANAALFGREESYIKWKYDDGFEEELPMDGGPETVEPEVLALGFWGQTGTDLTRMSSSYGPYALTRLCRETGGMYFVAETNARQTFDPAVMRNYQPDYRPAKVYLGEKEKNLAKKNLVEAAKKTKLEAVPLPLTMFRSDNDNVLKEQITEAQKPAAVLAYQLNQLYPLLAAGEKDRQKVKEPRWRAGYDLAMGRVLAVKVRFEGYNKMLAEMKATPMTFKKKESNQWRIVPGKEILAGADVKKMEKQAMAYLKRVIDEHPDTPWATLAKAELSSPMGWQWVEAVGDYPKVDPNETAEQKRARFAREEQKRKEMAKNAPPPRVKPDL